MRIAVAADERVGVAETLLDELRRRGHEPLAHGALAAGERGDWALFLNFAAYVTIFIGVVNLIPLPPLDGGHLMLLAWEKVTGRQADYRKLVPVSAAVIVFLSVFAIATVFLDITEPLPLI